MDQSLEYHDLSYELCWIEILSWLEPLSHGIIELYRRLKNHKMRGFYFTEEETNDSHKVTKLEIHCDESIISTVFCSCSATHYIEVFFLEYFWHIFPSTYQMKLVLSLTILKYMGNKRLENKDSKRYLCIHAHSSIICNSQCWK